MRTVVENHTGPLYRRGYIISKENRSEMNKLRDMFINLSPKKRDEFYKILSNIDEHYEEKLYEDESYNMINDLYRQLNEKIAKYGEMISKFDAIYLKSGPYEYRATYEERKNFSEIIFKLFLKDAVLRRPELSNEQDAVLQIFLKVLREIDISQDFKHELLDIMYNLLLNTKDLSHYIVSEEKMDELRIIFKNSLVSKSAMIRARGNLYIALINTLMECMHNKITEEEHFEDICKKFLTAYKK